MIARKDQGTTLLLATLSFLLTCFVFRSLRSPADETPPHLMPAVEPLPPALLDARHEPEPADASLEQAIEHMAAIVRRADDPGVSIAIIEEGKTTWMGGFGRAHRGEDGERPVQATADTLYRAGSISKSIISLAALRLEAEGKLRLDTPLHELLPSLDYENDWREDEAITVAHLLEHTSAFDELRFNEMIARGDEARWDLGRVLDLNPRSRVARWQPGTRHAYSQVGYTVAARALEQAARRDWESVIAQEVFEPLQMDHASFAYTTQVAERLATGYEGLAHEPRSMWHLHHRPGGNLFVSARDMSRVVEMLIAGGKRGDERFLPRSSVHRMQRGGTLPIAEEAPFYGLGLYPLQFHGDLYYGHGGWMPGYAGHYAYSPERGVGLVVFGNSTGPGPASEALWRVASVAIEYLDAKYPPPAPPEGIELPEYELEALSGYYRFNSPAVAANGIFERIHRARRIYAENGELWLSSELNSREKLVAHGPRTFARPGEREPSLIFHANARGDVVMYDTDWGHSSYAREGPAAYLLIRVWFIVSNFGLLFAAMSLFVWLPARLLGNRPSDLAFVSVAAWALGTMLWLMVSTPVEQLGLVTPRTAALFMCSWGFALASALSLRAAWRAWKPKTAASQAGFFLRLSCTILALVWTSWVLLLAREGLIGLRTWAW